MRPFFSHILMGLSLLAGLSSCGSNSIDNYKNTHPVITVKDFYHRPVEGYGVFKSSGGEVKKRFYATLVPVWHGNQGTLTEKQWNAQGKLFFQQQWNITVAEDQKHFTATATQIDGIALGETQGFAMHMRYTMRVPGDEGKDEVTVACDDWTYLQPDGSGINTVAMKKFGLYVGDVIYDLHPLAKGEKPHEGYFPP